ncbi:MAG: hypothetical protein RLN90_03145 [Balneolaceae bacterium]
MKEILLFFSILTVTGCSFKTVVHPYPQQFRGNPEEAIDRFEIQRLNNYSYIDPDTTEKIPFSYSDGSLYIDNKILRSATWNKKDSFQNPITNQNYEINALVAYNPEFKADDFIITMTDSESDSVLAIVEGLVEDATVFYNGNFFRFTANEFWEPTIKKMKTDEGTEWHHYPHGGSWALTINDEILGEIIQGSPTVKRSGITSNSGVSYTFLFDQEINKQLKIDLINSMLTYLALIDMDYYYYECNIDYPQGEACPGSIVVR